VEGNLEMHKHGATKIQEGGYKITHKEDGTKK
jgi:hypothetical protein